MQSSESLAAKRTSPRGRDVFEFNAHRHGVWILQFFVLIFIVSAVIIALGNFGRIERTLMLTVMFFLLGGGIFVGSTFYRTRQNLSLILDYDSGTFDYRSPSEKLFGSAFATSLQSISQILIELKLGPDDPPPMNLFVRVEGVMHEIGKNTGFDLYRIARKLRAATGIATDEIEYVGSRETSRRVVE